MELTKDKLEEFIREELDSNTTMQEVVNELEDVSSSLDDEVERIEDLVDQLDGVDSRMKRKLEVFYYQLLDKSSDLATFVSAMKNKYE